MDTIRKAFRWICIIFIVMLSTCGHVDGNILGDCLSWTNQAKCPKGQYLELDLTRQRCARCRGGLVWNSTGCGAQDWKRCAPGLICEQASGTCILDKTKCSYTFHLPAQVKSRPTCAVDGTFAAKQCKGDMSTGTCFCYSKMGERIFGWDWQRNAGGMECGCSRLREQLERKGERTTIHCAQNGNYEELQCTDGICWCANPGTGEQKIGTRAVPMKLLVYLPCYDSTKMSSYYLRQCESKANAVHQIGQVLNKSGFENVPFSDVNCGFDGNYGATSMESNTVMACTWYDGSIFYPYRVELTPNATPMHCHCALDEKRFASVGLQMTMICNKAGNYGVWQTSNRKSYCVDSDGFSVSEFVDVKHESDCDKYLYYAIQ